MDLPELDYGIRIAVFGRSVLSDAAHAVNIGYVYLAGYVKIEKGKTPGVLHHLNDPYGFPEGDPDPDGKYLASPTHTEDLSAFIHVFG